MIIAKSSGWRIGPISASRSSPYAIAVKTSAETAVMVLNRFG